ncbi:MAG TPA: type IV pilus assembly protein PilM [Polyangia bacterium]
MPRYCIGLDIGTNSVKAVQLKETGKGFHLLSFGIEPLPAETIVDGAIMNQSAVVDAIKTLRNLLGFKGRDVATAVSGHSVIVKKLKIPQMTKEELEQHIPWEAEQHIPFSKDEVEMDHQILGSQDGQMEVVLVAAKKEVLSDYSLAIREAKLSPSVLDVTAFTIQNAFEVNYTLEPGETVALINIGATMSTINILSQGTSAFTRDVAGGGKDFTEEIQKRLNVGQDEAEAWKIGGTMEGEVLPHEVEAVIAEVAEGMAGKLQRSLDFFLQTSTDAKLTRIYLSGGTARIPALQRALAQKSAAEVQILDPFRRIIVDEKKFDTSFLAVHAAQAAVAVGLALRHSGDRA